MSVKHALGALLLLPSLLATSACGSGTEQDAQSPPGGETFGETSAAFGENSCAYAGSNSGYSFVGSIPEPGFVTDADYSNPKCYKTWVAEIDNWASIHQDLVVADAALDDPSWHAARPPSSMPPVIQLPGPTGTFHGAQLPIGQADCNALSLKASLYKSGTFISTRSAVGQWVTVSGIGVCARPWVRFGGASEQSSGVDRLLQGGEYKVAATLRSGSSTRALKILTPSVACGAHGGVCCPNDVAVAQCDNSDDLCQSGTCDLCGYEGKAPCPQSDGSLICKAVNQSLTILNGICTSCGGPGLVCCDPRVSTLPFACGGALTCQGGQCAAPVVVQPPNPSWDPNCGNQYHQCCPSQSGKGACKLAQACMKDGKFLSAGDDLSKGICDNPGPAGSNCSFTATAVIDSCSGGSNILQGEKVDGCGSTLAAAQTAAVIGFGYANICIDNNNANCCSYHFE